MGQISASAHPGRNFALPLLNLTTGFLLVRAVQLAINSYGYSHFLRRPLLLVSVHADILPAPLCGAQNVYDE
jgi:hypothetical protein